MKIWKNTKTLDALLPDLDFTDSLSEAQCAIIGGKTIHIERMPKLKGIFKCGVGVDNVPFEEADKKGVEICLPSAKTKDAIYTETANFACYLIFRSLYSDTGDVDLWKKRQRKDLSEQKLLVIGHGNIGRRVVKSMQPFLKVDTFDVLENTSDELNKKVADSDIVTLHMPLTGQTHAFIDAEKLSWMKDGATLINTARGPIVEENALLEEISNGRLKAAFDVFWEEPYKGPLKAFHPEPFFMTPHVSSNSFSFLEGLTKDFRNFINRLR